MPSNGVMSLSTTEPKNADQSRESSSPAADGGDRSLRKEALDHLLRGQATVSVVPMNYLKITPDTAAKLTPDASCETCAAQQDCGRHGPIMSLQKLAKEALRSPCNGVEETQLIDCNAITTLPKEVCLCTSSIPGAGFGICCRKEIVSQTWMGPYEGITHSLDELETSKNTEYMWEVLSLDQDLVLHYIDGSDVMRSNWMRFVQSARSPDEQNLIVVQHEQQLYYQAVRDILPAEELLVWYAPEDIPPNANLPLALRHPLGILCQKSLAIPLTETRSQRRAISSPSTDIQLMRSPTSPPPPLPKQSARLPGSSAHVSTPQTSAEKQSSTPPGLEKIPPKRKTSPTADEYRGSVTVPVSTSNNDASGVKIHTGEPESLARKDGKTKVSVIRTNVIKGCWPSSRRSSIQSEDETSVAKSSTITSLRSSVNATTVPLLTRQPPASPPKSADCRQHPRKVKPVMSTSASPLPNSGRSSGSSLLQPVPSARPSSAKQSTAKPHDQVKAVDCGLDNGNIEPAASISTVLSPRSEMPLQTIATSSQRQPPANSLEKLVDSEQRNTMAHQTASVSTDVSPQSALPLTSGTTVSPKVPMVKRTSKRPSANSLEQLVGPNRHTAKVRRTASALSVSSPRSELPLHDSFSQQVSIAKQPVQKQPSNNHLKEPVGRHREMVKPATSISALIGGRPDVSLCNGQNVAVTSQPMNSRLFTTSNDEKLDLQKEAVRTTSTALATPNVNRSPQLSPTTVATPSPHQQTMISPTLESIQLSKILTQHEATASPCSDQSISTGNSPFSLEIDSDGLSSLDSCPQLTPIASPVFGHGQPLSPDIQAFSFPRPAPPLQFSAPLPLGPSPRSIWQCGQCEELFTRRCDLQGHQCARSSGLFFRCDTCCEMFMTPDLLQQHITGGCLEVLSGRQYPVERPFSCGFCRMTFAGPTTLQNHIRRHTGKKNYECKECGAEFSREVLLTHHNCRDAQQTASINSNDTGAHSIAKCSPSTPTGDKGFGLTHPC